ncbi:MAG TPA: hypothetical protein VFF70_00560, partial [Anaerolineae bacterium]|nr:hypothetical protein [Anaerolineae bacterium]
MQGGNMQFKFDQAGLMKVGLLPIIAAAIAGALYIVFGLWAIAGILSWVAFVFGGVWYVMSLRKAGTTPDLVNLLVNAAILGAVAGLVYGIVEMITIPMGLNSALGGLGGLGAFGAGAVGIGTVISEIIRGAIVAAGAAWV